ncbi:MAG: phage protease [Puniceicoccales bacterium]|jgi:hypothetical protein|nr:phage protease [Puniceicoccales bacterium]
MSLFHSDTTASLDAATCPLEGGGAWFKLVSYGEYPHRLGLQVVTREAAQAMADEFRSLGQRLARRFRGVPVYIGHPDDGNFRGLVGHGDTRAYGWVRQLEARDDGLWVRIRWSKLGQELLDNAHFQFLSPRWEMHPIGGGRFLPKLLVSIGLTNHPNIAGEAIANAELALGAEPAGDGAGGDGREELPSFGIPVAGVLARPALPIAANTRGLAGGILGRSALSVQLAGGFRRWESKAGERRLLALVGERMVSANETFTAAWRNVKASHPALFPAKTFSNSLERGPSL